MEQSTLDATEAVLSACEAVIATFAARQHGVVTRWQLLAAGISAAAIDWQIRRGRLHVIHRGAYRVGPLSQPRARLMAAVLLCGNTACLSHTSAAGLHGLLDPRAADGIHVSGLRNRRVPGWIRLHRVQHLPADETMTHDHLPVTTPARTLLDLAGAAAPADVEHAIIEAVRRRLADHAGIEELLRRYPRKPGARLLRGLLEQAGSPQLTRSEAERRLREIIRGAEIARPMTNVRVEGYEVDAYWPKERVVAEADGFALHSSNAAFQRDRRRDADFGAAGVSVIRFTWHQLTRRPLVVAARLGAILATARERLASRTA
jgi:very-short-patch-repair endonuclease